jgi:hypothetical protein
VLGCCAGEFQLFKTASTHLTHCYTWE